MTTPSEARASYEAIVAALTEVAARVEGRNTIPDGVKTDTRRYFAVLVPYLLGREPNGATEKQMLDGYAERAIRAVAHYDDADLYLYDGGYSRLLIRLGDREILALSGVSRDEVKDRWRAMFASSASPLRAVDGMDAETYVVSEPLSVEAVRARVEQVQIKYGNDKNYVLKEDLLPLYRDVLRTISADRGSLGDLARAALRAEE